MSERSLAMHLYRSFQNVMSTQESMWEELKDWVRNKSDVLEELGWESDGDSEELNVRRKFEKLLERYQGYVIAFPSIFLLSLSVLCPFTQGHAYADIFLRF